MSIPWWKWAQLPSGGSQAKPVQPKFWVIVPANGQRSVPLYSDGMLPRSRWRATRAAIRFSSCFLEVGLALRHLLVRRALGGELPLRLVLEGGELPAGDPQVLQAGVELALLGGGLGPQLLARRPRVHEEGAERGERGGVGLDAVGEGPVLVAEVEVGPHVLQEVGEGAGREERLDEGRPVRAVGLADPGGQEVAAILERGRLLGLLLLDRHHLPVQEPHLRHEVVVDRLDLGDPRVEALHPGLRLGQVGVDVLEGRPGRGDLLGEVALERLEASHLGPLLLDPGGERLLAGDRVGQLVAADRPRAGEAEEQREDEDDGQQPAEARAPAERGEAIPARRPAGGADGWA
jgi:hypothetical protein